ncbi:MAG: peptide-methionine (S)-S-oxide reductase MsrA [Novosphingobium sp.]
MLRKAILTLAASAALALPGAAQARSQTIVLAGGCFWGMEAVFEHVKGVTQVVSGYAGGSAASATYEAVSSEKTGHAEAVRITFDTDRITLGQILAIYFSVAHDPTQVNQQYPDKGPSYRSAVFPQNPAQRALVQDFITGLNARPSFGGRIATRIENGAFYPAEDYHQDFARKNPQHPYIVRWDEPRIRKLRAAFPQYYRNW